MASKTFASPTLSSTPSDIEVITEMDVFEASKEDVPRPPSSPVAPTSVKGFKWEKLAAPLKEAAEKLDDKPVAKEEPEAKEVAKEEPVDKPAEKPEAKEVAKEEPVEEPVQKPVEEPATKPEDDSDSDDDMPPLVEDSDSEGLPELVNSSDDSDDEMLIAVFRRPTCNRCNAALHVILDPEDSSDSDEEPPSPRRRRQDSCPSVITYTAAIFGLFYLIKIYLILTGGAFIVGPGYYGSCL